MKLTRKKKLYVLRTCNADMTSHGRFKWPEKGIVTAPDWSPVAECGQGLHGLLMGDGDASLLNWGTDAKWLVVEIIGPHVDLTGKVKFQKGRVVHVGTMDSASEKIISLGADPAKCIGAKMTGGDAAKMTGGNYANMTGGDAAKMTGGDAANMTGGNYAKMTGGDGAKMTGGYGAKMTGGDAAKMTGGYAANMTGGYGANMTGGLKTCFCFQTWDAVANRTRIIVGYVGEDGIEPNVAYKVENGKLVKA